jgi:hypothetical protein
MSNIRDSVDAWLALPTDSEECERGYDPAENRWKCLNDLLSCLFNDGHNLCSHDGNSRTPLEDAAAAFELLPFFPVKNGKNAE